MKMGKVAKHNQKTREIKMIKRFTKPAERKKIIKY